jgi:hypothetical protein
MLEIHYRIILSFEVRLSKHQIYVELGGGGMIYSLFSDNWIRFHYLGVVKPVVGKGDKFFALL